MDLADFGYDHANVKSPSLDSGPESVTYERLLPIKRAHDQGGPFSSQQGIGSAPRPSGATSLAPFLLDRTPFAGAGT